MVKAIERVVNLNIINKGDKMLDHHSTSIDKMTTVGIKKQINLQKIHNARTKRAVNNINDSEKTLAKYGGIYTHAEIKLLHDLHPYLRDMANRPRPVNDDIPNEANILEILKQLGMYVIYIQEDNHFVI